jgi:gamma-glutamyltranspeptidase/glutathione hydrolase
MAEEERVELSGPFPHRGAMRGNSGAVGADHPLAVAEGLAILEMGGSAADAAIAMAAVMVVVQPHYSHLGGDSFAMTFDANAGKVEALNSSGPAPRSADPDRYRALGRIPESGGLAVTVPGCVAGWGKLHERYGKLMWERLFTTATRLAGEGFPASRGLARAVRTGRWRFEGDAAEAHLTGQHGYFQSTFGHIDGDGGQRVIQPNLANSFSRIASQGADAFYRGEMAVSCREALAAAGAEFSRTEDWLPPARWEAPLSAEFAGHTVHVQPTPTQGFVLPLALRLYERLLACADADPVLAQREALARAFHVRTRFAGDPDHCSFDPAAVLDDRYLDALLTLGELEAPPAPDGDTTYVFAIDSAGNAVSFIQSVFAPWGSAVFDPGTGILFNNRMTGFRLDPGHPNELQPGKRPLHTLHSYLVTRPDGSLAVVGGTPGGHRQPQANLQVLDAILRHGMDPQDALDLPRWSVGPMRGGPPTVEVETRERDALGATFREAGTPVDAFPAWDGRMGRAYVATVGPEGIAAAGDLRGEGSVGVR